MIHVFYRGNMVVKSVAHLRSSLRKMSSMNKDIHPVNFSSRRTIAMAMSGGIDSSVAAILLQDLGYDVVGVFMRNWDSSDELGLAACPTIKDREDMQEVCKKLGIPAVEVDFVKEYWNEVFQPFLDTYKTGTRTPNPDVLCNRMVKFGCFREHVSKSLGIPLIATGHYARLAPPTEQDHIRQSQFPRLLVGHDKLKDQSYFLSLTTGQQLSNVLFPVGDMTKAQVKEIASQRLYGCAVLTKKESMGVCFIGKRDIPSFLSQYMTLTPGNFIDIDTGRVVGRHSGKEALTVGQGAKVGGSDEAYFIVSKENPNPNPNNHSHSLVCGEGDVWVGKTTTHPALFSTSLIVRGETFSWVSMQDPFQGRVSDEDGIFKIRCGFRLRHRHDMQKGYISLRRARTDSYNATYTIIHTSSCASEVKSSNPSYDSDNHTWISGQKQGQDLELVLHFDVPQRAVTAGQVVAFYDESGTECLGGGIIDR